MRRPKVPVVRHAMRVGAGRPRATAATARCLSLGGMHTHHEPLLHLVMMDRLGRQGILCEPGAGGRGTVRHGLLGHRGSRQHRLCQLCRLPSFGGGRPSGTAPLPLSCGPRACQRCVWGWCRAPSVRHNKAQDRVRRALYPARA